MRVALARPVCLGSAFALGTLRDGQDLGRLGLALHASRLSGP